MIFVNWSTCFCKVHDGALWGKKKGHIFHLQMFVLNLFCLIELFSKVHATFWLGWNFSGLGGCQGWCPEVWVQCDFLDFDSWIKWSREIQKASAVVRHQRVPQTHFSGSRGKFVDMRCICIAWASFAVNIQYKCQTWLHAVYHSEFLSSVFHSPTKLKSLET